MVKQGDIIKINFNPILGSEQSGYRPAVVVSNNLLLSKTNIICICPMTSKPLKRTALNVIVEASENFDGGTVLCAHIRSVDIKARDYKIVGRLSTTKLNEVLNTIISTFEPMNT